MEIAIDISFNTTFSSFALRRNLILKCNVRNVLASMFLMWFIEWKILIFLRGNFPFTSLFGLSTCIAAKYAKITNAFWNMSGYMQMITHEILKNYCISFSFLWAFFLSFFSFFFFAAFLQHFIHHTRLCATEIVVYMQRMIKMSCFRIANVRCNAIVRELWGRMKDVSCRRFNIIKICFIIPGLQINWNYHFMVTNIFELVGWNWEIVESFCIPSFPSSSHLKR